MDPDPDVGWMKGMAAHHQGAIDVSEAAIRNTGSEDVRKESRKTRDENERSLRVDFRTQMIPHHKGAVAMAKVALKHAKDPETKAMAQKIIDDQEKEISEMEAWLKKNGK